MCVGEVSDSTPEMVPVYLARSLPAFSPFLTPPHLPSFSTRVDLLSVLLFQINELSHINVPVMLMPDDFKAHSKVRVDNHLFNKYVSYTVWRL